MQPNFESSIILGVICQGNLYHQGYLFRQGNLRKVAANLNLKMRLILALNPF